jgi:hypothetical protein
MHPRCSEEFENHNLHTVNTKDSNNCFAVHDHNNHSNSAVIDCKKRKSSTKLEQYNISYLREESIPRKQHEKYPILNKIGYFSCCFLGIDSSLRYEILYCSNFVEDFLFLQSITAELE